MSVLLWAWYHQRALAWFSFRSDETVPGGGCPVDRSPLPLQQLQPSGQHVGRRPEGGAAVDRVVCPQRHAPAAADVSLSLSCVHDSHGRHCRSLR